MQFLNLKLDPPPAPAETTPREIAPQTSLSALQQAWTQESVAAPPAEEPSSGVATAVVVESNPVYRAILAKILERAGLRVQCAESAEQVHAAMANAQAQASRTVILVDCDEQEDRGLRIARAVRHAEAGALPAILIAITGSMSREDRKLRRSAGFDNYIAKPIRQEGLRSLLARYQIADLRSAPASLAIEQRTLTEIAELLDFDSREIEKLYRQHLTVASDSLALMRRALEDNDGPSLARHAQALRTSSGQTGAARMQDICIGIEALAHGGLLESAEALVQELSLAFEHVSRELFSPEFAARVTRETPTGGASRSARGAPRLPGELLVAEPDPLTARFLTGTLAAAGFAVTHVDTGDTALERIENTDFQAIVLSGALPVINGYAVLSQLRLLAARQNTPVVMLSASGQEHDMLRAFDLGADDYIVKPLNPLEVVCRIKRFLK